VVPVVRLDTIFRQKEGGRIVTNAHLINRGMLPVVNADTEFRFIEMTDEEEGSHKISQLYASEMAKRRMILPYRSSRRCIAIPAVSII
jgi:exodeoxyribonuclease V alpha subunit